MADYLPPVIAKLIADTSEHDRKWAESARTVKRAARDMDSSATRSASTHRTAAGQVGASWDATAGRFRNASGQLVAGSNRTNGALGGLVGASNRARSSLISGGNAASSFAAKLTLIAGAAGAAAAGLAVLPGLLAAVAGAGATMLGAFSGIGAALKGYKADQDAAASSARGGGSAASSSARQIRDAYKQIENAQRNATRVARDGAEQVQAAERRVVDAVKAEERAQRDLDRARKDAIRTLDDLNERVHDLALDQRGAELALIEAQQEYQRSLISTEMTELDRQKAAYQLAVAQERVRDVQREATQATQDAAEANAKGVEGSDQVVAAQEAVTAAAQDTQDAREQLARTERDAAEANEDAARQVADAMQQLADAQADAAQSAGAAAGASSKFAQAMAKLTPEGRAFVLQLIRMQELWKGLSRTAQRTFLPGLTQMLKDSEVLFPIFDRNIAKIGTTMGNAARRWGDMFKRPEFQRNLDQMLANSVPLIDRMSDGMMRLTDAWVRLGANKELSDSLQYLTDKVFNGLVGMLDGLNEHSDEFAEGLRKWGDLLEWLLPKLPGILSWFAEMGPYTLLLAGGVRGLGLALKGLKILKEIKDWAKPVKGVLDEVGDAADRNGPKVDGFRTKIGKLLKSVGKGALKGGAVVGGLAVADEFLPEPSTEPGTPTGPGSGYDGLKDITGGANQLITNPGSVFTEIGDEFDGMTEKFRNGEAPIQQWWSSYQTWVGQLPEKTRAWFTETKDAAVGKFIELRDGANQKTQEIVDGVTGWFRELPGRARDWLGRMKDAASQKGQEFLGWVRELPGRITGSLGDLGNLLWDKGKSLVDGLWGGIQSMGNWLYTNVWNWVKRVLPQPIKDALRIASPSKVAYDLASWVPEGMADALDDGTGIVAAASRRTAAAAVSGLHAQPALPIASPAIGPSVVPSITVNVAGHVLTERQLLDLIRKLVLQDSLRNTGNGLTLVGG